MRRRCWVLCCILPLNSAKNELWEKKQANMSTLRITGRGVCARPADRAELHLIVRRVEKTCAAASEAAQGAVKTLCARLRERGFDESGLKTTDFSVSPEYEEGEGGMRRRVQTGYACRIALRFALPFTPEGLSAAADALSEGAEELSIAFSVEDTEAVRREVVRSAWEDALSQAALFAEASGMKVGGTREVSLDLNGMRAMNFGGAAALSVRAAKFDLTPDDVRSEGSVTVEFELV